MLGAGAFAMYFLDAERGRRRRVALGDQVTHFGHESRRFAGRFRRDLQHRAEGTIAEAESLLRRETSTDEKLKARIRSILGRRIAHPDAVEIQADHGHVEVTGRVMAREAERIRRAVESVRGVKDVCVCLETAEGPEKTKEAEQKGSKKIVGLFGDRWSPTARAIVGGAGLALILDGWRRHRSPASKAAFAGSLLLARSVFNMPLRRVPLAGIHLEKTLHVHAGRDALFAFWNNPENYPKVFSHVQEVRPEGEGIYRWHVSGPAGLPVTWTGKITRQVAGSLVEWRSLPGSAVENHGVIRLDDAGEGFTRVQVRMEYAPPAGLLGHGVAALLGVDPRHLMHHDLVQLQSVLEHGFTTAHKHRTTASELGLAQPTRS
ncbi:MAG: SRPBCC family protein [Acidobacteriota bacterium]